MSRRGTSFFLKITVLRKRIASIRKTGDKWENKVVSIGKMKKTINEQ